MAGELNLLRESLERENLDEMSIKSFIAIGGMLLGSLFPSDASAKSLKQSLVSHEGYERKAYDDSEGHRTVGIGFNLDANRKIALKYFNSKGINFNDVYSGKVELSDEQIKDLFNLSLTEILKIAENFIPGLKKYPNNVKEVVIEMAFQLGNNIHEFKKTRKMIINKQFINASKEMMDSDWGRTYRTRAERLSKMMAEAK